MNDNTGSGHGLTSRVLWYVFAGIVSLCVLLVIARKKGEEPALWTVKETPVRTRIVAPTDIVDSVALPGRLEPVVDTLLAAETGGRIDAVLCEKGDSVVKGQVLVRIDGRVASAAHRQAVLELADAERELVRVAELRKTGAVSVSDFEKVEKMRDMAAAALDGASAFLKKCELRSPVDGVVDDVFVDPGEYVTEALPMLRVVDVSALRLKINVPERDVLYVAAGDEMTFSVGAMGSESMTGVVSFVSVQGERVSSSFRAELTVDNSQGRLRAGMLAEATVVRGRLSGSVVVPLAAVVAHRGGDVVFVNEDGRAARMIVRVDRIVGHEAVLSSGLEFGDEFVSVGHKRLRDGTPIRVVGSDDEAPADEGGALGE